MARGWVPGARLGSPWPKRPPWRSYPPWPRPDWTASSSGTACAERWECPVPFCRRSCMRPDGPKPENLPIENLFEAIGDMAVEFDAAGTYLRFFGPRGKSVYPPETFLGRRLEQVLPI